jgi:biotin carboxylase
MRLWFNQTWRGTYQLIGLLRKGAGRGLHVIGSHAIPSTPFLQACDTVIAEPEGTGEDFVTAALDICVRHGVDVFVPGREMLAAAEHAAAFRAAGVRVMSSPASAIRTLAIKSTTYEAAAAAGLPVPRTSIVTSVEEFRVACDELLDAGMRVCVKPDLDHGGRGFRMIDDSAEELATLFEPPSVRITRATLERLLGSEPSFPPLIVSEYLDEPEYSVDCVSDGADLIAAVARGKSGLPWTRELVDDPAVIDIARASVAAFGLCYLSNVQVRFRGDEPVLLEINTRAASGLHQSCTPGLNMPWMAMQLLLGEQVEPPDAELPRQVIAYTEAIPFRPLPVVDDGFRADEVALDAVAGAWL